MIEKLSFINKNFKFDIIRNNGFKIKKKLLKYTLQKMKKVCNCFVKCLFEFIS